MATVPGDPMDVDPIPKELRPTQADLLMAAATLHQQGRLASLGDPSRDYIKTPRADDPDFKDWQRQQLHQLLQPPDKPEDIKDPDKHIDDLISGLRRIKVAGDVVPFPSAGKDEPVLLGRVKTPKQRTQETLSRALGGIQNVLPMTPKDK